MVPTKFSSTIISRRGHDIRPNLIPCNWPCRVIILRAQLQLEMQRYAGVCRYRHPTPFLFPLWGRQTVQTKIEKRSRTPITIDRFTNTNSKMASRRLSTLWAHEARGSQRLCLSGARRIPAVASTSTGKSAVHPMIARSYSQGKVSNLAKNFRRPGNAAETYVAYGMTQKLFEACSTQADYKIPQASQKGVEVPKTEAGEDLGVGESWWYTGESIVELLRVCFACTL